MNERRLMGLGELLDEIRELYCQRLLAALSTPDSTVQVLNELALRKSAGDVVEEGVLELGLRADVVTFFADGRAAQTKSVDSMQRRSFDRLSFSWGTSLGVHLDSFFWDALDFDFAVPSAPPDWTPLVDWFRKWFRAEEDGDGGRLLGVVHFLSDPEIAGGRVRFSTMRIEAARLEAPTSRQ